MNTDTLRPPPLFDPSAAAYKDWLHLNVFDHASGTIGIFNASLHGSPSDPRSRAVGTALVHEPGVGWIGNVEVAGMDEVNIGTTSIGLEKIALATDPSAGTVLVSARLPSDGLEAGLTATVGSRAVDVSLPFPFGPGWISWYVVPRLSVEGGLLVRGRSLDLAGATAYHDHNWGRWHWGDEVGWEWAACSAASPAVSLVVVRPGHPGLRARRGGRQGDGDDGTMLLADVAGERRSFASRLVEIEHRGRLGEPLRRLPGALAALHQDRIAPRLPERILVSAADGIDRVELEIQPRAAAQVIAADPSRHGYGFIHEMVGRFEADCRIGGRTTHVTGLAVFEYVD
ncbi:MAG: hypothetical protein ABI647_18095 [Gemmatimonadota bacterium]